MLLAALLLQAAVPEKPLLRDFLGLNGHTIQFRPKLYAPVGRLARDYHPVEWDLGKETDFVPTFPFARNRVNWETTYAPWKAEGWDVNCSLMFETIPQKDWKDVARDARAYGKAFAKAFGPSSPKALVSSAEVGNEPGKWDDPSYRAMFEAMATGLREGDPKLKVATCALIVGKSHDYAKSVDCVKGFEALYDALNVHSYAELEPWPTWRRSHPEDPKLKSYLGDLRKLIDWRNANAPGKPVWLTEFGYDSSTKKPEPKGDFAKWVGVTDEQQAQWLVRSTLVFLTLDLARAYIYFFDDKDEASLHAASGLTRNFQPKPSFHALAHLQRTLGEFRLAKVLSTDGVYALEFVHADGKRRAVAAWSPTGEGRKVSWRLPADVGRAVRAERMPLGEGPAAAVDVSGEIPIDESPVYIQVER
jgi:hypothetical protein